ncbi:MAG: sigma 54-interacting transcriptional regulator [Bacillota bacterium]
MESELFGYVEGAFTGASKGERPVLLNMLITGPCSLMKSGNFLPVYRLSCSVCSRKAR